MNYVAERLYLELQPTVAERQRIVLLQQELLLPSSARLIRPAKLHVTLIHFGILSEVYGQLTQAVPALNKESYMVAINHFVDATHAILPEISLAAGKYALYGPHKTTLVLEFKSDPTFDSAHERALQELIHFFVGCGIEQPRAFMAQNHNFQYALSSRPHLTLARNVSTMPAVLPDPPSLMQFEPVDLAGL